MSPRSMTTIGLPSPQLTKQISILRKSLQQTEEISMERRSFVKNAGIAALAATAGDTFGAESAAAGEPPTGTAGNAAKATEISTSSGRLRGTSQGGVSAFKGIPYAEPPVGPLRFRSPQPVRPWKGTRDALEFGPAAIQTVAGFTSWVSNQPQKMSEDCLTLNIWAPTTPQPKPVIVWIHGGGYRTGSGSMPLYDGTRFAEIGNVVLVTINYRLGVLGWSAHRDLTDATTGHFANWAVQDQIEALRWVKENIAAFGGDPTRVTVMGQSGGAINAVMIAHSAAGKGLFHQGIIMGAPYICPPSSLDIIDWKTAIEALAAEFNTNVGGLRDVPAIELHQAELRQWMQRTVKTDTGRAYRGAVKDDQVLHDWPAYYALPDIPMIIGNTSQEGSILFDLYDPVTKTRLSPPPADEAAARAMVQARLGMLYYTNDRSPMSGDIIEFYQQCAREDGRDSSWLEALKELFGDSAGRHYSVRKAEEAVRNGRKDIFFYQYGLPLMPPNGLPGHATELSILFGTFADPHYREKVGDGEVQQKMSRAIIEAFSTFAANGRPSSPLLPSWPSFQSPATNVMVLGENGTMGQVRDLPKYKQLSCFDQLAAMRP